MPPLLGEWAILALPAGQLELAIGIVVTGAHPGAISVLVCNVLHPVRAAIVSDVRVVSLDGDELYIFAFLVLAVPDRSLFLAPLLIAQLESTGEKVPTSWIYSIFLSVI